jgi:hypothetical protein
LLDTQQTQRRPQPERILALAIAIRGQQTQRTGERGSAMFDILLRVVIGGIVVSAFAALGDVLKPKSFAGLFGAAPSVALATVALTIHKRGPIYASIEGRSMILGAVAFFIYACVASRLMIRHKWPALPVSSVALLLWLGAALGFYFGLLS